jgi:hypothetical protein
MNRAVVLVALVLALAPAAVNASEHLHPRLKARKVVLRTLALVPLKVDFIRVAVTGPEPRSTEAEILSSRLSRAAVLLLGERGIDVIEDAFARLHDQDEGRYAVADLQARYDRIAVQMRRKPKDVGKGRFTLGDEVSVIASKLDVSALLFVRAIGSSMSAAARAMNPFAGVFRQQITYEVVVVDPLTGDVLFLAANPIMTVCCGSQDKQIEMLMRRAIKKLPKAVAHERTQ